MSVRFSIDEAQKRGWISEEQAKRQRAAAREKSADVVRRRRPGGPSSKASATPSESLPFCFIDGDTPQQKLWRFCVIKWPDLRRNGGLVWELSKVVPGRKYSIDIAFPLHKLSIECDGWEYHGKYLKDFKRDREKDRALTLNGWRVLRYFASEINQDRDRIISEIETVITMIENATNVEVCNETSPK